MLNTILAVILLVCSIVFAYHAYKHLEGFALVVWISLMIFNVFVLIDIIMG